MLAAMWRFLVSLFFVIEYNFELVAAALLLFTLYITS
jgi:hypothetical protein